MNGSAPIHPLNHPNHQSNHNPNPHDGRGPNQNNIYCTPCIQRLLRPQLEKHSLAIAERDRVREWCSSQLDQLRSYHPPDHHDGQDIITSGDDDDSEELSETTTDKAKLNNKNENNTATEHPTKSNPQQIIQELKDQQTTLQQKLEILKNKCAQKSILLASKNVKREERAIVIHQKRDEIIVARQRLDILCHCVLDSSSCNNVIDMNLLPGDEDEDENEKNHEQLDPNEQVKKENISTEKTTTESMNKETVGAKSDTTTTTTCTSTNEDKHETTIAKTKNQPTKTNEDQEDNSQSPPPSNVPCSGGYGLTDAIQSRIKEVQQIRFQMALQAFEMHRMDVGEEYANITLKDLLQEQKRIMDDADTEPAEKDDENDGKANDSTTTPAAISNESKRFQRRIREKVPSGIGKIAGLPLPHTGPSLYLAVLPSNVLTTSLRLVATLTNLVARCLGIVLPHPILLRPLIMPGDNIKNKRTGYSHLDDIVMGVTSQVDWKDSMAIRGADNDSNSKIDGLVVTGRDFDNLEAVTEGDDNTVKKKDTMNTDASVSEQSSNSTASSSTIKQTSTVAAHRTNMNTDVSIPNTTTMPHSQQQPSTSSSTQSLMSLVGSSSSSILSRSARFIKNNSTADRLKNYVQKHSSSHGATSTTTTSSSPYTANQESHDVLDDKVNGAMPPMDTKSVSMRIKYASCAVICESNEQVVALMSKASKASNSSSSSKNIATNPISFEGQYELRPPQYNKTSSSTTGTYAPPANNHSHKKASNSSKKKSSSTSKNTMSDREALIMEEENFNTAMQLLQSNVIALCIQAGVPVNALWPAEALLLNLHSLRLYCSSLYQ